MGGISNKSMTFAAFADQMEAGKRVDTSAQFIGGAWRSGGAEEGDFFEVISPTTEEPVARVRAASKDEVADAVQSARAALVSKVWSQMSLDDRVAIVERVCGLLAEQADQIARVQTEQMGAPISGTRGSVERRVVANMKSNIRAARRLPSSFVVEDEEGVTIVDRRPIGVVAAIVPWNGPLSFEADKVTAALLTGSTVVLKAAPEAPLEAFALAGLFAEAGLPAGAFNVVAGAGDVGETLVSHPDVARVTFTGSTATGKRIAGICASRLARVSLELGGKSPAIVLPDADLDLAARVTAMSNFGNSGQACHAVTRVLVPSGMSVEFVDRVGAIAESLKIGDPRESSTTMGPLVAQRQRARVEGYIAMAREAGASVAVGGGRPSHMERGWFVEPTVLTNVTNDMRPVREEIFGPVMSVLTYESEEDAITVANDSDYGLGGAVFSADPDHGLAVARQINTGTCAVNSWGMTRSAPFGGVKNSGLGREHGVWGLEGSYEIYSVRPDRSDGWVSHLGREAELADDGARQQ
jgi:acyl-CoA reductase-like NAD-dependent aldehyde dehydrogenase